MLFNKISILLKKIDSFILKIHLFLLKYGFYENSLKKIKSVSNHTTSLFLNFVEKKSTSFFDILNSISEIYVKHKTFINQCLRYYFYISILIYIIITPIQVILLNIHINTIVAQELTTNTIIYTKTYYYHLAKGLAILWKIWAFPLIKIYEFYKILKNFIKFVFMLFFKFFKLLCLIFSHFWEKIFGKKITEAYPGNEEEKYDSSRKNSNYRTDDIREEPFQPFATASEQAQNFRYSPEKLERIKEKGPNIDRYENIFEGDPVPYGDAEKLCFEQARAHMNHASAYIIKPTPRNGYGLLHLLKNPQETSLMLNSSAAMNWGQEDITDHIKDQTRNLIEARNEEILNKYPCDFEARMYYDQIVNDPRYEYKKRTYFEKDDDGRYF